MAERNSVEEAFDMLLKAIDEEIDSLNQVVAKAFERREYFKAHEAAERANALSAFRQKVAALHEQWKAIGSRTKLRRYRETGARLSRTLCLPKGAKTPEREYYIPILQALVELGGSAKTCVVLDRVYQIMKGTLKPVDHGILPSKRQSRWANTAQWARDKLVRKGLLKPDSPNGIWEITSEGRRWLKQSVSEKRVGKLPDSSCASSGTESHQPSFLVEIKGSPSETAKLASRMSRQQGVVVQINGQTIKAKSIPDFSRQILRYVVDTGLISKIKLPFATSRVRYLIAREAIHPGGKPFVLPVEYKGYYMEAHKDYRNAVNHALKLLSSCGHNLKYIDILND